MEPHTRKDTSVLLKS